MPDKYAATWLSHSSISDFLKCPRCYYLKNVYKSPATGNKIQVMSPALALGQAVHEVLESLSVLPITQRFETPLLDRFDTAWHRISGKKGGFTSPEQEARHRERGEDMLRRVMNNPGPVLRLAVKINKKNGTDWDLPYYWISEEDEMILCGKIDWLEYLPDSNSVNILDFKTGKRREADNSFQLPIYHLLVDNLQHRTVTGASYWYLESSDVPEQLELPDLKTSHDQIMAVGKQVKLARKLGRFRCENEDKCAFCKPYNRIINGEGELIGTSQRRDIYVLPEADTDDSFESEIL